MEITKQDIRALKHADLIGYYLSKGEHYIRAILNAEHSSTGFEQDHRIDVDGRVTYYGEGRFSEDGNCYHLDHAPHTTLTTRTWLDTLREGDELVLVWVGANNNETLKTHGLAADELYLRVLRKRTGKQYEYMIDTRVCPADSTARMVRPY